MMFEPLLDEEIEQAIHGLPLIIYDWSEEHNCSVLSPCAKAIARAAEANRDKQFVEWLESTGTEEYYWKDKLGLCIPIEAVEALKKEIEELPK